MKRWSYATAIMLSLAGGTIMTGCIDNDEPYGIEQIRLATADFLKSKKAAVEAEAAAANAQVEIEKIKAETEKLRIEAEAAIKAAQAKILEAQANKEQAEADKIKAETDAYIAAQKAALDEMIALAEINIKDAQLKYDKALYQFEQTKIENAEAASNKLYQAWEYAFQAYLNQLANVNELNKTYLYTQKNYAMAQVDLKYENGKWVSDKYDAIKKLGNSVTYLEKQIAQQNKDIEFWEAYIADMDNVKASELYAKYEKYSADAKANVDALENAQVELKALAIDNKALYDSRITAEAQVASLNNEQVAIAAYTTKAMPNVPFFQGEIEVIPEGWSYSLNEIMQDPYYNKYKVSVERYNNIIGNLERALMDSNDVAWTNAMINEMTRELEAAKAEFATAEAEWTLAKKVYNDGKVADASVLPYDAEIDKAIADYVAEGASIAALRQAKIDAESAQQSSFKAWQEALNTFSKNPASVVNTYNEAVKTFNSAYNKAQTDYAAAVEDANNVAQQAVESANQVYNATLSALNVAEKNLEAANIELAENPTDKTLQDNQKTAQAAYDKAFKAANEANDVRSEAEDTAEKTKTSALNLARASRLKAEAAALTALHAAESAFLAAGGYDNEKDPAYAAVKTAADAYNAAVEATESAQKNLDAANAFKVYEAYVTVGEEIAKQEAAIDYEWRKDEYNNVESDVINYCYGADIELPVLVAPASYVDSKQVYYNAQNYVVAKSMVAFGNLGVDYDKYAEYGFYTPDKAFLVENVDLAMVNAYIKAMPGNQDTQEYNYHYYYVIFGLYGDILNLEYNIGMAKAVVGNSADINAALATLNENLTAIEDGYVAQNEKVEKAEENLTDINDQIAELESDVTNKIEDLQHWNVMYTQLLSQLSQAIAAVELGVNSEVNIEDILAAAINNANEEIKKCNNQIEYLNKQLDKAKYQLGLYEENKDTVLPNPYTIALEVAEANLAAAQEKLAFLKAHADELQAKYEAASKQ